VDFMIAKSSLIMAFKSEKCYDYVDPNAGPHIAVADGGRGTAVLGAAIVEDMYTPVTAPDIGAPVVNAILTAKRAAIQAVHDDHVARATTLSTTVHGTGFIITARELAIAINDSLTDTAQKLLAVDNERPTIEARLLAALVRWEKLKEAHEEKVAGCIRVFTSCLGPDPKSHLQAELEANQFRKAWVKLNAKYDIRVGGHSNISDLFKILNNVVFNPNEISISEHCEKIRNLCAVSSTYGDVNISDNLMLTYILESVEKSNVKEYVDVVNDVRIRELTLQEAEQQFQRVHSSLMVKKATIKAIKQEVTPKDRKKEKRKFNVNLTELAAVIQELGGQPKKAKALAAGASSDLCTKCGKAGHSTEGCWAEIVCKKCGGKGHPEWRCKTKGDFDPNKKQKQVQIGALFKAKK